MRSSNSIEWSKILDSNLSSQMQLVAVDLGTRLVRQYEENSMVAWPKDCFESSPLTAALVMDNLDRILPNHGFDRLMHQQVALAVQAFVNQSAPRTGQIGLFSGLTGFNFATSLCSSDHTRYKRLFEELDQVYLSRLNDSLAWLESRERDPWKHFDIISGSSGVIRYLIHRQDDARFHEPFRTLCQNLIAQSSNIDSDSGFFVKCEDLPTETHQLSHPRGCVDCGFAHGVPGVLASLSLAELSPQRETLIGNRQAIVNLLEWLYDHRSQTVPYSDWPYAVTPGEKSESRGARLAWCYGSIGIAVACLHASRALEDRQVFEEALATVFSATTRYTDECQANPEYVSMGLCHGMSGILQILLRCLSVHPDPSGVETANVLGQLLLDGVNSLIGQQNEASNQTYLHPGFLEGDAGSILMMSTANSDASPDWDRLMLLC